MSNVNIKRAIDNIRSNTTIFTPIVELIVNSIQAIEEAQSTNGKVEVIVERSPQLELDQSISPIENIRVRDNGIGFTQENRDSFDELYSDYKIQQGGKGFGRLTCLKYFEDLHIESVFVEHDVYKKRTFSMGKKKQIIINEKVSEISIEETGTTVSLFEVKNKKLLNKQLSTIARSLVEKLLPYFVSEDYSCPEITLCEADSSERIILNEYINKNNSLIQEMKIKENNFTLGYEGDGYHFSVRIFKIYSPKNQSSKISLIAHQREVTETPIHNHIPEFIEEFYDKSKSESSDQGRNYIIKTYVFGEYLDDNVSLERGGFDFSKDRDLYHKLGQTEIEKQAANITKQAVGEEIATRVNRKEKKVFEYVEQHAPWHKGLVHQVDLASLPYNADHEDIEVELQKIKIKKDSSIRRDVSRILEDSDSGKLDESVAEIVEKISEASKNDLVHYVASRRQIIEIFRKSLKLTNEGKYNPEGLLHDIIFPKKKDSNNTVYDEQNLWIVDERLNFTSYLSSDIPLKGNKNRPDVIAYGQRVAFRGDNETSNPVTIFEFKKPGKDDFINPSKWKEDPIEQIIRYVNAIIDGDFKTPEGLKIQVTENTPFYGYVICEITKKVEDWLVRQKGFKPLPDKMGWFKPMDGINLYMRP
jgi:hypothetical protein